MTHLGSSGLPEGEGWSEWQDSNLRPPAPEAGALPGCATLRFLAERTYNVAAGGRQGRRRTAIFRPVPARCGGRAEPIYGATAGTDPAAPAALLGRSQEVRQRILIPPFGGSIPPAPATTKPLISHSFLSFAGYRICGPVPGRFRRPRGPVVPGETHLRRRAAANCRRYLSGGVRQLTFLCGRRG